MSNTVIQLKYSNTTATPASLSVGEAAYSFQSDKLFIGNSTNHVLTIGGQYYTDLVDAATDANTSSAIVKRDASGMFSATAVKASLYGNANTATTWLTARTLGVSGDATGTVSVDGSANANIPLTLTSTGVGAGTYGGTTSIPVFTVDAKGRITSAANATISTALAVSGDTGTGNIALATDTLTITGRDGVTTQFVDANNTILVDVDNTVVRTTGGQTISGDLNVTGNLFVSGNTISIDVTTLSVVDPLLYLAANNYTSDLVDIGFVGNYFDGNIQRHTGLVRHASDGKLYAFDNYDIEPFDNIINIADSSFRRANLVTNIIDGTISNLASDLAVVDGGTGAGSFTNGQILLGQGTNALTTLANVAAITATVAAANTLNSFTTDTYGRVTGFTQQAIDIDTDQISSGTLPINRGGTNNTTYTTGAMLQFDGTKIATLANTTYTLTGGLTTSNTITSLTVDAYGRVTAATGAAINIAASQIGSGTLGVTRGGTGAATFTNNGILLGQGTNAVTTVSSSTEGHVLTINASGVPQFGHISGGTF